MNCPRCERNALVERERDGIEIDVCSGCRGVWLDRGELDKLIARAARYDEDRRGRDDEDRRGRDDDDDDERRGGRGRRGGFFASLGDIFD